MIKVFKYVTLKRRVEFLESLINDEEELLSFFTPSNKLKRNRKTHGETNGIKKGG